MSEGYYADYADVDGDGTKDDLQVETNADGSTTYMVDTDNDGTANIEVTDTDSDGVYDSGTDSVEVDTDGDGVYDETY
ncbi:MAG: hypothetical protein ACRDUA_20335 [Micromonosporaceae bacterium]